MENELMPQILVFASTGARQSGRKVRTGLAKILQETKINSVAFDKMKSNFKSSLKSRKRFREVLMVKDMRKDVAEIYEATVEVASSCVTWKKKGLINFRSRFPIDEKTRVSRPRSDTVLLTSGRKSVQLNGPEQTIESFVREICSSY